MLSHANLLSAADALLAAEHFSASDEILCYLPMAWIGDSLLSLVLALLVGFVANCPESPETVQRDLRELGPTVVIAPPRIWENLLTSLRLRGCRCVAVEAQAVRIFPASGRAGRAAQGREQEAVADDAAAARRSENSWFMPRSAISWASAARA